jgi:galactokinase
LPDIKALRDVSPEDFQKYEHFLPQEVRKRARHVVYECDRVDQAVAYLRENNAKAFGKLMFECHASLRDDYEVSIPELDTLVDIAAKLEGCIGSRLTGAGFGGCTVSLVSEANSEQFIQELATRYFEKTGIRAEVYLCQASQGVEVFETGL